MFLLREVFGYEYAEVAFIVGKSEANCRQISRRARWSVAARLAEAFHRGSSVGVVWMVGGYGLRQNVGRGGSEWRGDGG